MKISLAPMAIAPYRSSPKALTYKNDIQTMYKRVKMCGYEGIETGTPVGFTNEEFKDYMDEIGLEIVSCGGLRYPDWEGDDFKAKIEMCHALGAKNAMISTTSSIVLGNPDELKKFIKNVNRVGKMYMDEGIHLSYHNHAVDFTRVGGRTIFEQLVEQTDERYVFFEPDTHWLQAGGAHVITWLKKLKGRMYVVHFKDYGIDPYSDHTFLECTHKLFMEIGEGNLNWPGIIAECHAQNIEWCSVEQDRVQRPPYEAIELSVNNLRAFGV